MTLIVQEHEREEENMKTMEFESYPVEQNKFGEYIASLHAYNSSTFVLQYQVKSCSCII